MADIQLHIIGAGRAAITLAQAWVQQGALTIGAIMNRSLSSSSSAVTAIGSGRACADVQQFRAAMNDDPGVRQWLLIGVPDSEITAAVTAIAGVPGNHDHLQLAFHLSGQSGPEALTALRQVNAEMALVAAHPVVSFARSQASLQRLHDSYCLLQCDEVHDDAAANAAVVELFAVLGMRCLQAPADLNKAAYHAALVLVSNYQCALHSMAAQLLADAGLERGDVHPLLASLAHGVAENLHQFGALAALTGPLERGDIEASGRVLEAMGRLSGHQRQAAYALTSVVLDMASRKGSLSESQLQAMRLLLQK